ncbi:hypothetical protein F5Y17DRAFT_95789 [Xylariaceae sp. FL0594]|nr:hypothetical protein F5Y17DRAFT_95789 [Xylariaceae sp. FL0594]
MYFKYVSFKVTVTAAGAACFTGVTSCHVVCSSNVFTYVCMCVVTCCASLGLRMQSSGVSDIKKWAEPLELGSLYVALLTYWNVCGPYVWKWRRDAIGCCFSLLNPRHRPVTVVVTVGVLVLACTSLSFADTNM